MHIISYYNKPIVRWRIACNLKGRTDFYYLWNDPEKPFPQRKIRDFDTEKKALIAILMSIIKDDIAINKKYYAENEIISIEWEIPKFGYQEKSYHYHNRYKIIPVKVN